MAINQHKQMAMNGKCGCDKMKKGGPVKKVKDTDKDAMKKGGSVKKGGKC